MASPPADKTAGFSLLEALAALMLTALLFATAIPVFVGLIERWGAGMAAMSDADLRLGATMRISDDLAEALPIGEGAKGRNTVIFRGTQSSLSFVRPGLDERGRNRLDLVSLSISSDGGGSSLSRSSSAFSTSSADGASREPKAVSLIRLLGPARFAFVDAKGRISSAWVDRASLPSRVELRLAPADARLFGVTALLFPIMGGAV